VAIRDWFRPRHDRTGNLPLFPGICPDQMAAIVRTGADGERELVATTSTCQQKKNALRKGADAGQSHERLASAEVISPDARTLMALRQSGVNSDKRLEETRRWPKTKAPKNFSLCTASVSPRADRAIKATCRGAAFSIRRKAAPRVNKRASASTNMGG
jgi:hypothetical protein